MTHFIRQRPFKMLKKPAAIICILWKWNWFITEHLSIVLWDMWKHVDIKNGL